MSAKSHRELVNWVGTASQLRPWIESIKRTQARAAEQSTSKKSVEQMIRSARLARWVRQSVIHEF